MKAKCSAIYRVVMKRIRLWQGFCRRGIPIATARVFSRTLTGRTGQKRGPSDGGMAAQQYDLVSRDKTGDSWVKALRKQTMEKRMALARLLVVFIEALAISWALLYLGRYFEWQWAREAGGSVLGTVLCEW